MAIEFRSRVARAEAPKRALGAFLPDPCPCELAALATQPFHPEANRYMCRSYHTGRGHPACDAVLRHAPVASLDGTLHRHLHALEQSPAYLCFSADQNGTESKLNRKDEVLAIVVEEMVRLKKNLGKADSDLDGP
jgi:hypothetical protein